jgi:DNA-binding transcriptional ArsR family regulator
MNETTESFFMALADKTRLRILNLLRSGEVCVLHFTDVLGESQPKISRHLAYLRRAGVVAARRDGKWMHYSIRWPEDRGAAGVLDSTLDWLASDERSRIDLEKYGNVISRRKTPEPDFEPAVWAPELHATRSYEDPQETRPPRHNDLDEFLL